MIVRLKMTWSIIARDHATGQFGIAVATKFFAVGALRAAYRRRLRRHRDAGAGQSLLRHRRRKAAARGTQPARDRRDADRRRWRPREPAAAHHGRDGRIAAHTGRECVDWCGHVEGDGFSIAGNMLAGAAVLDDTAKAYVANAKLPFAQRLIAAMQAGEAAGGDKRGKQSAALLIHGEEEWSALDLRVDDHADPLRRTRAAGTGQPRALGAFPANSCRPARIRPGSPIAPPSTPASKPRLRARDDGRPADRNRGPARHLPRRRRPHHACGRQRRSQRRQWRDARAGRRIRLRQERDLARHHGAAVEALRRSHRLDPLRRFRSARSARRDPARSARQPARDDLPGADDLAQSELYHRRPDHRDHPAPSRRIAAPGARARHRTAAPRPHPLARKAHRRISAQAFRRHAPARDDRDGAGLRSRGC